jgi:hypothetical protein
MIEPSNPSGRVSGDAVPPGFGQGRDPRLRRRVDVLLGLGGGEAQFVRGPGGRRGLGGGGGVNAGGKRKGRLTVFFVEVD